jgi:hypothetical protein
MLRAIEIARIAPFRRIFAFVAQIVPFDVPLVTFADTLHGLHGTLARGRRDDFHIPEDEEGTNHCLANTNTQGCCC